MLSLLNEYRKSLRKIKIEKKTAPEEDQKIYSSMEADLEYAIQWLETGQRPTFRRSRIILFKENKYWDIFNNSNVFDLYARNPYEIIEEKIDMERINKTN